MKIRQIKETCLYIKDLNVSRKFYQETLGLDLIGQVDDRHVFFRVGTSVLLLFIAEATRTSTTLPSHFASGSMHVAFEVPVSEYDFWKKKIQLLDIEIIQEQGWKKGLKSFYFRDPDGHLLEIVPEGIWE